MPRQEYFAKSSFTQLFNHLILAKTTTRIKLLSTRGIQRRFVFNELNIVIEIFCALRVEESKVVNA